MNDPKPFASLGPSLLARKGAARPAMRPQLQPMHAFHEATARQLEEDLGWNDMGHDHGHEAHVEHVAHIEPEAPADPVPAEVIAITPSVQITEPRVPEVVRQIEAVAAGVVRRPRRSALAEGRRAAFTLRLDADRHLKLRLASAIAGRSAQQLVTDALDRLIATLPDVDTLAAQVSKRK